MRSVNGGGVAIIRTKDSQPDIADKPIPISSITLAIWGIEFLRHKKANITVAPI